MKKLNNFKNILIFYFVILASSISGLNMDLKEKKLNFNYREITTELIMTAVSISALLSGSKNSQLRILLSFLKKDEEEKKE